MNQRSIYNKGPIQGQNIGDYQDIIQIFDAVQKCEQNDCINSGQFACVACGKSFCARHLCSPENGNAVCLPCFHKNIPTGCATRYPPNEMKSW